MVSSEGKISSYESSEVKSSGLGIPVKDEVACSLGLLPDRELWVSSSGQESELSGMVGGLSCE